MHEILAAGREIRYEPLANSTGGLAACALLLMILSWDRLRPYNNEVPDCMTYHSDTTDHWGKCVACRAGFGLIKDENTCTLVPPHCVRTNDANGECIFCELPYGFHAEKYDCVRLTPNCAVASNAHDGSCFKCEDNFGVDKRNDRCLYLAGNCTGQDGLGFN